MNQLKRVVRSRGQPKHIVMGIDPSLSSTGFAYRVDGQLYTGRLDPGKLRDAARLAYMRKALSEVLDHAQPTLVAYEHYAIGAKLKNNNAFSTGELGGVLKTLLWERGIDVMLVAPTCLKKTIVGNGNADRGKPDKPEMRAALRTKFGYDIEQNDEADAFALMLLGQIRFNGGLPEGVRKQLRLDSINECPIIKGRQELKLIANR